MAQPSRLDQTANINSRFNNAGDVDHEKKLSQYQLTPDERQKLLDLRQQMNDKTAQEKESFADEKEFKQRFDQKYAELAQRNNVPTPEHLPPGARNKTLPRHHMVSLAHAGVNQDHDNKLKGYQQEFQGGMNDVLKNAASQGRGPQPQQQQRDANRQASPTQDYNKAAGQGSDQQRQDFNRASTNDNSRDHDR